MNTSIQPGRGGTRQTQATDDHGMGKVNGKFVIILNIDNVEALSVVGADLSSQENQRNHFEEPSHV